MSTHNVKENKMRAVALKKEESSDDHKTSDTFVPRLPVSRGPRDFTKICILGKGDVGIVYLVCLKGTDQLFAMKVLKQKDMIHRNKVKRVLTEREILVTTKHPFIVSLQYSFQSTSRLYFVMDYCAGGEFYRTIQSQPHHCLTEDQMRFYAAEVLLALEYLHMMGFVYRDLKPENILLHATGHIRLTDFDLSKASVTPVNAYMVASAMGDHQPMLVAEPKLITNSFVGTAEYMAPEVIVGQGYGASVDWWTFGILMYEMLYGVTPFRGQSQTDTFDRIEKAQFKFPEHARCTVSKDCKNLIKKLLSRQPKKRLGYEQGAAEIKSHGFFSKITWSLIRNQTPPIVPNLTEPLDLSYFRGIKLAKDNMDDENVDSVNVDELSSHHPFKTFVSVNYVDQNTRELASSQKKTKSNLAVVASSSSPPKLDHRNEAIVSKKIVTQSSKRSLKTSESYSSDQDAASNISINSDDDSW
jgi:protein-serine/threonine kinase